MPIQHWTKDTTSQSSWQGTQALAGGISGGIKSLTDSIEAARKERKKESDLTTVLRKKLTVLNPDRKDEFNTMGLNDLTGEDMAHAESVLGEKRKMEMDQFKQRSEAFNADQVDRSRRRADEEGFNRRVREMRKLDPQDPRLGDFYENPENYQTDSYTPQPFDPGQGTANQPYNPQPFNPDEGVARQPNIHYARPQGRITPDQVLDAGAEFNQLGTSQFDNLYNAITRAQPKEGMMVPPGFEPTAATINGVTYGNPNGGKALGFEEDPVSGQRFATHGNSVLPSGRNPSKQDTEAQQLFDADGNLIGHNVPTGAGKFTFRAVKQPSDGALKAVIDPNTGKPVLGFGMDANGRVHDLRSQMDKLGEVKGPEKGPGVWASVKEFFGAGGAKAANPPAAPADGAPAPGKMTLGADGKYHFTR